MMQSSPVQHTKEQEGDARFASGSYFDHGRTLWSKARFKNKQTNKQVSFIKATRGEKLAELLHLFCNCVFAIALLVRHDHLLEIVFN